LIGNEDNRASTLLFVCPVWFFLGEVAGMGIGDAMDFSMQRWIARA
jgi:hypothetical protein